LRLLRPFHGLVRDLRRAVSALQQLSTAAAVSAKKTILPGVWGKVVCRHMHCLQLLTEVLNPTGHIQPSLDGLRQVVEEGV
jgi:hypothetical protein